MELQGGNISMVCFKVSEFEKGRERFRDMSTRGGYIESIESVKESLIELLKESFGDVGSWMAQFEIEDGLALFSCELPRLLLMRSTVNYGDPEADVALATAIVLKYGSLDNAQDEITMLHVSTLMNKLEPFCLSALQKLISDIVAVFSNLTTQDHDVIMRQDIESYLKKRNKSVSSTMDVVQKLSLIQFSINFSSFPLLSKTAQKLEALERNLSLVWNRLGRASSLALTTSDSFTLSERVAAAIPACSIMRKVSEHSHRKETLAALDAVWQLMNLGSGIDVIFISATKAELSTLGTHSVFVAEWLASTTNLSKRIQFNSIKQLLASSTAEHSTDLNLVLLPAVNATDFNNRSATKQNGRELEQNYRRKLDIIRKAMAKIKPLERQPHAFFLYISDSYNPRYIETAEIVKNPTSGLCMCKNFNPDQACLLLSEQAVAACAELPFITFERSRSLHMAQSLRAIKGEEIHSDMLQASFGAFSWFSNTHGPGKHIGQRSRLAQASPRQWLTDANEGNFEHVMQMIINDPNSRSTQTLIDRRNIGKTTTRDRHLDSGENDGDDSLAGPTDCEDQMESIDCAEEITSTNSHQEQTLHILRSVFMTRSIQIDFQNAAFVAVYYMLIQPHVECTGQVSRRRPVATYIAENVNQDEFVNCTCDLFSEKSRAVRTNSLTCLVIWFFGAKQILFRATTQVQEFCPHAKIRDPTVLSTFSSADYKWNGTDCSVTVNCAMEKFRQTSISVTAESGLRVVERCQHAEVVSVKFTSCSQNEDFSTKMIYSVLCTQERHGAEGGSNHAFVQLTEKRLRLDRNPQSKPQLQLYCSGCNSRLIQKCGRRPCVHIQSVSQSMSDGTVRTVEKWTAPTGAVQTFGRKPFSGSYNPDLVNPDGVVEEQRTGFVYENGTYTKENHDMDFLWENNQLRFGHASAFQMANEKNRILQEHRQVQQTGEPLHYKVEKDTIIQGELPDICPRCSTDRHSSEIKEMKIILYMSDMAVVHSSVDYWTCTKDECRLCVHTSGYSDGFWFISKNIAISTMVIWDYITLQMMGRGHDLASYHSQRQLMLAARMGDKKVKMFSLQNFTMVYFEFISRLRITFNQPCFGCTADALDRFPNSTMYSDVQEFARHAPPGARDVSCVGVDGLARMFADTLNFEKPEATPNDADDEQGNKNEDTSNPKSSVAGSCKCCKKINFASRQFDRSPIKKNETGSQTTATQLRKEFLELGSLIKCSRTNQSLFAISDGQNAINSAYERVSRLIPSDKGELARVLSLVLVCGQPNLLVDIFGVRKTHRLLQYTGELLRQLAGSNSVLTLLKPWAIRDCLAFCDAYDGIASDELTVDAAIECLAKLKSLCQPKLATPGPLAASLAILLEFVVLAPRPAPLQSQVNVAVVNALRFVAVRTAEVMDFHRLHVRPISECDQPEIQEVRLKGYGFPLPVRFPGRDINKEFTNEELGIPASPARSNPVQDNGAYFFTKTGGRLREPLEVEAESGGAGDCGKPGFSSNDRAGRAVNKMMGVFLHCGCHGEYMGYRITRNEGRKDPFYALFCHKPTFPHNISYDFCCG